LLLAQRQQLLFHYKLQYSATLFNPYKQYLIMIALKMPTLFLTSSWSSCLIQLSHAQNLQLSEWQQANYAAATAIDGRTVHAGAYLSLTNEYLVYGGARGAFLSDCHSINMTSLISTRLSASTPLGGRYGMAYTSDHVSNFYVHGGRGASGKFYSK
jgi:hypothetical protein